MQNHADVVVVGGGAVGGCLALALAGRGLQVVLLEARSRAQRPLDPRAVAISHGAALLLERLGAWDAPAATPIRAVHVSEDGHGAHLTATEAGLAALGYVIRLPQVTGAIEERLEQSDVVFHHGSQVTSVRATGAYAVIEAVGEAPGLITARLAVLADGGLRVAEPELSRLHSDYRQTAVVAHVTADRPPAGIAYERFTATGPVALLPLGEGYAVVWAMPVGLAAEVLALPDAEFLDRLQIAAGAAAGVFTTVRDRGGFPLRLQIARRVTGSRLAVIGNAAQTLHPVAAQGLNIGLRDAWELAQEILAAGRERIGSADMLQRYAARRRFDRIGGIGFTDALVRLAAVDGLRRMRGAALDVLEWLPGPKRFLLDRLIYGVRS